MRPQSHDSGSSSQSPRPRGDAAPGEPEEQQPEHKTLPEADPDLASIIDFEPDPEWPSTIDLEPDSTPATTLDVDRPAPTTWRVPPQAPSAPRQDAEG